MLLAYSHALMAGESIHRLPVIDGDGAVCGILSALDIELESDGNMSFVSVNANDDFDFASCD